MVKENATVDGKNPANQLRLVVYHSLSHYLQGFIHPRWCRISSINSTRLTKHFANWWFQPVWKICLSNWIISPNQAYLPQPKIGLIGPQIPFPSHASYGTSWNWNHGKSKAKIWMKTFKNECASQIIYVMGHTFGKKHLNNWFSVYM